MTLPNGTGNHHASGRLGTGDPRHDLLSRLRGVVAGRDGRSWAAVCPAHEDRKASLSVTVKEDGTVLLKCHRGCSPKAIVSAIGLNMADLFPADGPRAATSRIDKTYDYLDEAGRVLFQVVRFEPKDFRQRRPDGKGGWLWGIKGVRRVLYRLPDILAAARDQAVFIVEGEKDADRLAEECVVATTCPMGAGKWDPAYSAALRARPVVILPDNDEPGRKHARDVAGALRGVAASVKIVELPGVPAKGDVSDWFASGGTVSQLWAIVESTAEPSESQLPEAEPSAEPKPAASSFAWKPLDSAAFAGADYRPRWLLQRLLVRGQPAIIGGPKKVLKTNILVDLAISLASGRPFLGRFTVYEPRRVALLSGESGDFTLQETALRVCRAKDVSLADLSDRLLWQFALPQLANVQHMAALEAGLKADRVEVLIIDPLYLALLAGAVPGSVRAENLFDMGPLLQTVARVALAAGATPCLVHHSRMGAGRAGDPLELGDLAFAGIGEFARQWLLLSRRKEYDPETGFHELWLSAGGSIGHGGLWAVDIDEGLIGDDFEGRRWGLTVRTATEAREAVRDENEQAKRERQLQEQHRDEQALMAAIDRLTAGGEYLTEAGKAAAGYTAARDLARLSGRRMLPIADGLIKAGLIRRVRVKARVGSGASRLVDGLRRVESEDRAML
jgi:hypothetical protein